MSFPVISEPGPGARGSSAAVLGPEAAAALGEPLNLWCWSGRGEMECGKRVMGVSYKSVIRQT